jgi:hypothetical protein
MIVYYVADEEKPKDASGVQFFTNHSTALEYASDVRKSLYEFEVNDKCDTNTFGMDTQMLFTKDFSTGELTFIASGRWVEIHELMNIPFYYDFEFRAKNFVSMSLRYFKSHYCIQPRKDVSNERSQEIPAVQKQQSVKIPVKEVKQEKDNNFVADDVISDMFGV